MSSEKNKRCPAYRSHWVKDLRADWMLYCLLIPGLIYIIVYHYIPMFGLTYAFRDYSPVLGAGDWVGTEVFEKMFARRAFRLALTNNIKISLLKLVFGFPVPIILSLMINEIRGRRTKKFIQSAIIIPNFLSWFIISGLLFALFNVTSGTVTGIIRTINPEAQIVNVLSDKDTIMPVVIISYVWQASGIGTVVYLAAITSIDQDLYEAAMIDGAGKWKQMWHITLTSLRPTIITLFIFRIGKLMSACFDQIFALSNALVQSEIDIIDTYVYRIGMESANFSEATAAGLFTSVIGLVLVLATNFLARRLEPDSAVM